MVDSEFIVLGTQELNSKIDKKFNRGFNIQYIIAAASISVILFFGALYILSDSTQKDEISIQSESFEEKLTEDNLAPKVIESEDDSDLEESEIREEITVIKVPQPSNSIKKETKSENKVENTFAPSKSEILEDV